MCRKGWPLTFLISISGGRGSLSACLAKTNSQQTGTATMLPDAELVTKHRISVRAGSDPRGTSMRWTAAETWQIALRC